MCPTSESYLNGMLPFPCRAPQQIITELTPFDDRVNCVLFRIKTALYLSARSRSFGLHTGHCKIREHSSQVAPADKVIIRCPI